MKNKTILVKAVPSELVPRNGRKSFGRKAFVLDAGRRGRFLKSYDTVVCSASARGRVRKYFQPGTATTCAHVKSFLGWYAPGVDVKAFNALPVEPAPAILVKA